MGQILKPISVSMSNPRKYTLSFMQIFFMKNTCFIVCLLILISCNSTKEQKNKSDLPDCITKRIEEIKQKKVENPPIKIIEYTYNGKRTFLFGADCCDQYDILVDENCVTICAPTGGIDGGGDRKCPDFSANAKEVKLLWSKPEEK